MSNTTVLVPGDAPRQTTCEMKQAGPRRSADHGGPAGQWDRADHKHTLKEEFPR